MGDISICRRFKSGPRHFLHLDSLLKLHIVHLASCDTSFKNSYTIKFQFRTLTDLSTSYVTDINIVIEVADGLPTSNP